MRDEFEQYAGDVLQLSPLHSTAATFQWTPEQEAAAAAASEDPSDVARRQQQQQQQQEDALAEQASSEAAESSSSSSSSSEDGHGSNTAASSSSSSSLQHSSADESYADHGDSSNEVQSEEPFVSSWAAGGWLVDNPLGVPTEREHYVQAHGGKVFRVLLVKQ
jgi:hypothetical protein